MMLSRPFDYLAWYKPTEKMFKVYGISGDYVFEDTLDGIHTSPTNPAALEDCVLLQYSGVFDKSGALIYEADLIDCHLGVCIVEFSKGSFWAKSISSDNKCPLHNTVIPRRIGNFFTHPSLTAEKL
jgi:hypothetical protein